MTRVELPPAFLPTFGCLGSGQECLLEVAKDPQNRRRGSSPVATPHPRGLLDAFQAPQDASRRLKTPPRRPQDAPRDLQEAPRGLQEAPRCRFWKIFWIMLEDFGKFFGGKLVPKSDQKSISTLKTKNQLNASRLAFSWLCKKLT